MHQILLIIFLSLTVITAESGYGIEVAKDIRLENLKRDHSGKFISFMNSDMETGQGILLDVTDKNIIISEDGARVPYDHSDIDHVFVDPEIEELAMVFCLGALGGIAGYLGIIIGHSGSDLIIKGASSSLGAGLASFIGYRTFYRPIKIDISGKAYG
tara:strand:- start:33 stop:503 length:471 start_codon:yes stop_codon:yes gene_type:complete